jgi:hypothetical protein
MTKNGLIKFWEERVKNPIKLERASKSLQRQAEIDVASAQEAYEAAKDEFDSRKLAAKDDPKQGFNKIVEAHKDVQIAKKKFNDKIDMYEMLFQEKPRLLDT